MDTAHKVIMEPQRAPNDPLQSVQSEMAPPRSPTRTPAVMRPPSKRHTKGLSLNFPIVLPPTVQNSLSPVTRSPAHSTGESALSSPGTRSASLVPFRSPELPASNQEKSRPRGSADFLTLLASQERKVLELKEELQRAEADLVGLKKQWAVYESNKKRDEVRQVKKLQPVALDDVPGSFADAADNRPDEERRRKREIIERNSATHSASAANGAYGISRKGSKRIFEGRHARTLSLLSPTAAKTPVKPESRRASEDDLTQNADSERSSLSRMPTLDSLMSGESLPLAFGKTYKDLAAHRRSLPPVAADLLVKQGKQVYDGVKDGLWTFFEDIRQATVGEEGIHGTAAQQRGSRQIQRKPSRKSSAKNAARQSSKEPSFWKEFGLDTPQKVEGQLRPNGHVPQKDSTDSSNPPSLLMDFNDEGDDSWDAWESPVSNKSSKAQQSAMDRSLPWPEIQRDTPKLTRTISDLMKDWNSSQAHLGDEVASSPEQTHILDSPHI
jgi:hypothetical protein